ncbi:putative solute-binding protein [Acinetobacter soli]|uniref:RND transporter n=1 Tax=Acinetobacter soli TaxID=487316 RepID=A0A1P8EK21_9GAMM|nr:RND transporter [Acinetobacter soli]
MIKIKKDDDMMQLKVLLGIGLYLLAVQSWALETAWCVYDPVGSQGEISRRAQDIAQYAQSQQVKITLKSYKNEQDALKQFDQGYCSGVMATNFHTRQYNQFMGGTAGVGFVSSHQVAKSFMQMLSNPSLKPHMVQGEFEALGMIPLGMAYMVLKRTDINSVSDLKNKKIAVLAADLPQIALVQSVRAQPVPVQLESAVDAFKHNQVDILPAPIFALRPYNLEREFGPSIRVVNFPLSYVAINVVIRHAQYPKGFGQSMRSWFALHSASLIAQTIRWENGISSYYWMDVSYREKQAYELILARVRQQFIRSKYYDPAFVALILRLRCMDDPRYFECQFR